MLVIAFIPLRLCGQSHLNKISVAIFFLWQCSVIAMAEVRSPESIVFSSQNNCVYVADVTSKMVQELGLAENKITRTYQVPSEPTGLALSNKSQKLYITSGTGEGLVSELDTKSFTLLRSIKVGHSPMAPVVSKDGSTLFFCSRFSNKVCALDLISGKIKKSVMVTREPVALILSQDETKLFVANHLPTGAANVDFMTSVIDILDCASFKVTKSIPLPNGAISLRSMTLSPDGKTLLVPSTLARFLVPTTQLDRGWMNTHALNSIDVDSQTYSYTVLLDDIDLGAANPWGVSYSEDGLWIAIAHSGTHELSLIDANALTAKLKNLPKDTSLSDPNSVKNPLNDLSFIQEVRQRVKLPGLGPRGVAASGNTFYVTQYFSGDMARVTPKKRASPLVDSITLGPTEEMNSVRRGELYFNDARLCYQQWQSCSTCHPDVRTDAVNWDLLNDGIGNPKSTKSLLFAHVTPPVMITGIRDNASVAVRTGMKFIQFLMDDEKKASDMDDYLKSVKPIPSPFLVEGKLSPSAQKGKVIFEKKAACMDCHSGPYFTDMKKYDVKSTEGMDEGKKLDVPTLREVWRTAPYLANGKAEHLEDVFLRFNLGNVHGETSELSKEELAQLLEYVRSL